METIGMILYRMFCANDLALNNCENDGWDSLDTKTKAVWEATAAQARDEGWDV